jgi:hypothetical protein
MERMSEELGAFEQRKHELVARYPGQFAIVCGTAVLGVVPSLEAALDEAADRFERGALPAGSPILISEIALSPRLRVTTELR